MPSKYSKLLKISKKLAKAKKVKQPTIADRDRRGQEESESIQESQVSEPTFDQEETKEVDFTDVDQVYAYDK
jgi:hypothetical protein